jgi:HEAT repeat protein
MLLALLNDPDADMRDIGAQVVSSAIGAGQPVPEEAHSRLIQLVGDASADVRHQVAVLMKDLADPNALDAMLIQLQVENTTQVKIDLLQAIARQQQNVRENAVPTLERLLQDPSPRVAAEAATALRAIAPVIQSDPAQARQVFQDLLNVMQSRTGPAGTPIDGPGLDDLRAALVGAMATLANADPQDAMDVFSQLVNQNESPRVRRAAVQGLAPLGERSAEIISQELNVNNEPDPAVRQAAALALGQIGSFSYAQRLYTSMQRQVEPDQLVREAAWKAFQALLQAPSTTLRELYTWADLFHRQRDTDRDPDRAADIDREVFVRKELTRKLVAAKDLGDLAIEQQRIGEIYLLDLKQPTEAVVPLSEALNYLEKGRENNTTTVRLVRELMQAYLESGQFQKAISFGEQEINRDPGNQDEIGPAIRNMASRLVDKGLQGDAVSLRNATTLIGDALAMNPPLKDNYLDSLRSLKQTLSSAPSGQ